MPRILALIAVAVATFAAGCGDSKKAGPDKTVATATQTTTVAPAPATDAAGCAKVKAAAPRGPGTLSKPKIKLSASKTYTVTLKTNCGEIDIRLDVKRAPKTSASFASLVRNGFYNDLTFHRVVPDFVIQGGDPLGNGQGGPGYNVVEKPPGSLKYVRGLVAMAKAGVDPSGASGSQFFIVTAQDAGLTPDYALVGKVTRGMGTVDKITAEPVNPQSVPLNDVVIQKATLVTK
jgi:peptidyl-prolyl cis-trans isomerase B (cyclophilin B)